MSNPRLCLSRAPGLGVAFVDPSTDEVKRGYSLTNGDQAVREIAARFVDRAIPGAPAEGGRQSYVPVEIDEVVDILLADWREFTGLEGVPGFAAASVAGDTPVDLRGVSLATRRDPAAPPPDWTAIRLDLESNGLLLRAHGGDPASPLACPAAGVSTLEIVDADEKVVAEGKGLSDAAALHSALGEAVERIQAQTVEHGRVFLRSQNELRARGVMTPHFEPADSDLFSAALRMEWVAARTLNGIHGALPAELAYYPYARNVPVKAFSRQHTSGLAAGATAGEAAAAALMETIETDAYWLSMRTHRICGVFGDLSGCASPAISDIARQLADLGIRIHAGLINFDWPLSVVHVVLESQSGRLPALSHGLGSGVTHLQALERALLEAVQVHAGLSKVVMEYWPQISLRPHTLAEPALIWSSPAFTGRIIDMFDAAPPIDLQADCENAVHDFDGLQAWLAQQGFVPWVAPLGRRHGLEVVRVFLEGAVSAFSERGGPSGRVRSTARRLGVRALHFDAMLT